MLFPQPRLALALSLLSLLVCVLLLLLMDGLRWQLSLFILCLLVFEPIAEVSELGSHLLNGVVVL